MAINGKRIAERYKNIWNKVRDEISRYFTVVIVRTDSECPNCYYSSAENASSGQYKEGGPKPFKYGRCPVCGGKGKITTKLKKEILGDIVWKGRAYAMSKESFIMFDTPGVEYDNIVRIKVGLEYKDLINNAEYLIVDGYKCSFLKPLAESGIKNKATITFYAKTREKDI